jgi:hypothetical protein
MIRLALAALAAVTLVLAGAAQAKAPPSGMDFCGPNGCAHLDWQTSERFWTSLNGSGRPVGAAPYYLVRWHFESEPEQTAYYVPQKSAVHWLTPRGRWASLGADAAQFLNRAIGTAEPYPVPTLTRVTVGRRVARDPQSYLRLLDGKVSFAYPNTNWLSVKLESATPSPWTNGTALVRLGKTAPYVVVDGWTLRIPRAVAKRARQGLSLAG